MAPCGPLRQADGGSSLSSATLIIGWGFTVTVAAALLYAARTVWRRPTSKALRAARARLALWWAGAATLFLLNATSTGLYLLGVDTPGVHRTLHALLPIPITVALWALATHLIFLYTGHLRASAPVGVLAFLLYGFAVYHELALGPWNLEVGAWEVHLVDTSPDGAALHAAYALLVLIPIFASTVAYAALVFRLRDPTQRFRVLLVSAACLQWVLVIGAGIALGAVDAPWFPLLYQAPGIVAALLVVLAYSPPAFLLRALGLVHGTRSTG
ncbi:MAG TPA: hypothetical protein VNZ52_15170 [Candidatus Thermoplasmatota archaeon]|nr:hypothetical protein [Candidatus Thermoplasmatota archaeon]